MRLEAILNSWNLKNVVNSLINAHPYEEPAYDIYSLKNENSNFGFGVIGELQKSLAQNEFLNHVCKSLKTNNLRYTAGRKNIIKKVAVCGGSGADLLENAISQKADAFVTADIKYHPFQDADGRILFIDAGHYETEIHVLNAVKQKLKKFIKNKDESIVIYKYSGSSNPVRFYNN
jgi:putative NIF3 family GTP cyclohydrolase 1 type 2